jgi:hypothetical protein
MLVSSRTLQLAMREVLRGRGLRAGQCLRHAEIERAWRGSGLRPHDLRDALRELVERGFLTCPPVTGELKFQLTDAGDRHFFEPAPQARRTAEAQ